MIEDEDIKATGREIANTCAATPPADRCDYGFAVTRCIHNEFKIRGMYMDSI